MTCYICHYSFFMIGLDDLAHSWFSEQQAKEHGYSVYTKKSTTSPDKEVFITSTSKTSESPDSNWGDEVYVGKTCIRDYVKSVKANPSPTRLFTETFKSHPFF